MSAHVACTFQFMLLQFLASWLHIKKHAKLAHEQRYKNRNMQDWFRTEREGKKKQFAKTYKTWTGRKRGNWGNNDFTTCKSQNPDYSCKLEGRTIPSRTQLITTINFSLEPSLWTAIFHQAICRSQKIQGSNKSGSCATRHLQWTKISLSTCTAASNSSVSFARNTPRELLC